MIKVSRLNGKEFYINPELIEFIEETPDTVITMTTGKKIITKEPVTTVIEKIIHYKRKIYNGLPAAPTQISEV